MKTSSVRFLQSLALGGILLLGLSLHAQTNSILWHAFDNGGGTSTNGVYSLSGSIGLSVVGSKLEGNDYTVVGNWGMISLLQTPGAPALSIYRTSTNTLVVAWPSVISTNWMLRQNTQINSTNWTPPPESVFDNGTNRFILITSQTGNRYFRLVHP